MGHARHRFLVGRLRRCTEIVREGGMALGEVGDVKEACLGSDIIYWH